MSSTRLPLRHASLLLGACLLAACATGPVEAPPPPPPSAPSPAAMVAAIQAAGAREQSVIAVQPLTDPGIAAWQQAAQADMHAGRFAAAATTLDQALQRSPDSPELLQDRAEVAIQQRDYAQAQRLAEQSWKLGPKLGPLCARNWETMAQLRKAAGDAAGAATAGKWLAKCHVPGVKRY